MNKLQNTLSIALLASLTLGAVNAAISEEEFFEKRAALIETYSKEDPTFATLQKEMESEETFSSDYWRWRIDQYLYGQYTEFQPIYDEYTKGKDFTTLYDVLPDIADTQSGEPSRIPDLPAGYFSENLPGNVHTGSSLVANGKVYISYQGELTDPYIASYDLKTGEWDGPYKAGHSTLSKDGRKVDSHGRPVLVQDTTGHFHIIYGGHGGEWIDGLNPLSIDTPHAGGRLTHVVSEKPNDISSFVVENDVTPFASYTAATTMANGDIYFFTRAGTHKSPWVYYKMERGSQTFNDPVVITWPTPQKDNPINVDTFYITPARVSDTEIVITYLWHECNFKEIHDKTHYSRINTYYMKLDTSDDTFYNVEGQELALPITKATANELTLAYNSEETGETCFGTHPLVLADGRSAAAYEAKGPDYREWRMVVYEDSKWTHSLSMPGTVERRLKDRSGNEIKISSLEVLEEGNKRSIAAVVYKNKKGEAVFATAKSSKKTGVRGQDWQVEKEFLNLSNGKVQLSAVTDDSGDTVALVLNLRKGAAQRLYLFQDGKLRGI